MAQTIVLRKVIDNKVDPTSASIAHHDFVVGSSATVWAPFQPTSSSSSTNEFTIQVPGQNSLWSRKVMMRTTTGLSWNVLVSGSIQCTGNTTVVPNGAIIYLPYRYGVDFGCTAFPFNSLVQTCNSQINGSTINCQASQVMPVIRRIVNTNKELRQKLACPTGVVGTSNIGHATGNPMDEMSLFSPNDSCSGAPSNAHYSAFQFTNASGQPVFTNYNSTCPSFTGSVVPTGTVFYSPFASNNATATLAVVTSSFASNTVLSGNPQFNALTNGSTYMLPIVINSTGSDITVLQGGILNFNVSVPVYGSLTTTEPLLFPPFTYNDEEVAFTNVQSANIRLTMLSPNDRMSRILRNIEAPGNRVDTVSCASYAAAAGIVGLGFCTPQIQLSSFAYGNLPNSNGSGGQTPFNITAYANFLSPSLLEPIPETLNYPFLQYYPLVTTNGQLTPAPMNALTPYNMNRVDINSGVITSNVITLNTCPDMLALYVVMNTDFSTASAQIPSISGLNFSASSPGINDGDRATLVPVYVQSPVLAPIGSTVTSGTTSWTLLGSGTSAGGLYFVILNTNKTTWVTATYAGAAFTVTPPTTTRDASLSYSDILANIINVSVTWNNNAALMQSFLPSELIEITGANGLSVAPPIAQGVANTLFKATTAGNQYASLTMPADILAEKGAANARVSTIGSPILLAINKDLPTEAGTAPGVSGVYTLQVTITTRLTEQAFLLNGTNTNAFQFFVTPIQTQYLQLIRGGTSAVVSAVAAADKMLTAPFAPRRTLQGESAHAHKLTGGWGWSMPSLSGVANNASKLWSRASEVANAVKEHALPAVRAAIEAAPALQQAIQSGDYSGAVNSAISHGRALANAASATRGALGQGAHGYGAHGMGMKRHRLE